MCNTTTFSSSLSLHTYSYDCDNFTKEFYHHNFGIEDFTPIQVSQPPPPPVKQVSNTTNLAIHQSVNLLYDGDRGEDNSQFELQNQFSKLTLPEARKSNISFCCCIKVHTVREEFSYVVSHCTV